MGLTEGFASLLICCGAFGIIDRLDHGQLVGDLMGVEVEGAGKGKGGRGQ